MTTQTPSITASILYNLIQCPHRVALDAFADPAAKDPENPFVALLWERGTLYEKDVIASLDVPFLDLSDAPAEDKERLTRDAMDRGEPLIYGGRLSEGDLVGVPDLLRREGDGYTPGDIKSGNGEEDAASDDGGRPKLHYAVQLALYTDLIAQIGKASGRNPFIWDIRGHEVPYDLHTAQGPRTPETLWDEYESLGEKARAILAQEVETLPAYSSTCKLCHWYTHCTGELERLDDLSLIPMLGRKLRDVMATRIATVSELAQIDPEGFAGAKGKTVFSGLRPDRLKKFKDRARLLSTPGAKAYLTQPITLRPNDRELFFDIEVDPLRDICYLHGIVERHNGDNSTERFIYFFTEEETDEEEQRAFAGAFEFLTADPNAVIYYYSKYERTIYRKLQEKYPEVCTRDQIEALFDPARAIDLYFDVVTKATEWPTRDHSIKTLAKHLGFGWRDTNPSGAASIQWFDEWVKSRSAPMRQRILDYNEDDCRATRVLLDGILALS